MFYSKKANYVHLGLNFENTPQNQTLFSNSETTNSISLCSTSNMNNFGTFQNEGKNQFQNQAKEALAVGNLSAAFSVVQDYIQKNKNKFLLFLDEDTDLLHIAKQLNRFDYNYIKKIKQHLSGIKNLGVCSIMHIVLTLSHSEDTNYIIQYKKLKSGACAFIEKFKDLTHNQNIQYFLTYECKIGVDGLYHQHLHLLIFNQGFLAKSIVMKLKQFWRQKTGSKYVFFKYIPKDRNMCAFNYAIKYVIKEIENVNLTSVLLFSVKGKSYTMSLSLQKIISTDKKIKINNCSLKYLFSFDAKDVFNFYPASQFGAANLSWFFSFFSAAEVEQMKERGREREAQIKNIQEQEQKQEQENKRFLQENTIVIK